MTNQPMTRADFILAISIAALMAALVFVEARDAMRRHREESTPEPKPEPVLYQPPGSTLEWRAPMPPMHSREPLKISI